MRFREIREDSKQPKLTDAQFHAWAAAAAEKYDVPLPLMMHVMRNETGHLANDPNRRANAVSSADAQGVMQIQPATGKQHGLKNPFEPKQNIEAGARILGALLYKYDGNHNSVLAAYNAGQGTVDDYLNGTNKTGKNPNLKTTDGGVPPFKETQHYIFGQTDKKGNVIKPAYDPNAQYDVAAIKAAEPTSRSISSEPVVAPAVKKPDPIAVAQAKIDKMPAWDSSKNASASAPSQAQVTAVDNKIAAAAPAPVVAPVTTPPVIKPAPGGDAKRSSPAQITPDPAPIVKTEPAPKPIVTPAPVVKTEPAPAVDQTGGAGRVGPTIAALKGTDINNPLNKGSAPAPAPVVKAEPATAPAPTGDWKSLASANKITDPNLIKPGQELKLPGDLKYTVSKGDTLSGIASGNYKGTAPITPTAVPPPPPEITTDRLKALSGNGNSLPNTSGPLPTIDLLNKAVKDKTSSADLVPDIKTAQADTDTDDLEKLAVAETFKTINTRRYPFLLGL
jgi:hypothetical protein